MGRAGGWNGVTLGVTLPAPRAPHFALLLAPYFGLMLIFVFQFVCINPMHR